MTRIVHLHPDAARPLIHVFGSEGYLLSVPRGFRDRRLRLRHDVDATELEEIRLAAHEWEAGKSDRRAARAAARRDAPVVACTVSGHYRDRRGRNYLTLEPGPSVRASQDDLDRHPVGSELDAERVGELRAADAALRVGDLMDALCAVRPRTETEIRDRLGRRGVEASPALDAAIERRRRSGLIVEDAAFARWYVERRGTARGKGLRAIAPALRRLVADEGVIEAASSEETENEAFERALAKTRRGLDLAIEKDRRRLAARLTRRGFGWERISGVLEAGPDDEL